MQQKRQQEPASCPHLSERYICGMFGFRLTGHNCAMSAKSTFYWWVTLELWCTYLARGLIPMTVKACGSGLETLSSSRQRMATRPRMMPVPTCRVLRTRQGDWYMEPAAGATGMRSTIFAGLGDR